MTLKEKVAEIQPDCIDDNYEADGVKRCPSDYAYLNKPELYFNSCECKHYSNCCECWNQPFLDKFVDKFVDKSDNTEQVNHPTHYSQDGRRECIEEMRVVFGDEAVREWCILTAYKYMYRAGNKSGNSEEQDKAKMAWYLDYAEKMEGKK